MVKQQNILCLKPNSTWLVTLVHNFIFQDLD